MNSLSIIQCKTSNSIFKSNINALVSIYNDSEEIRIRKANDIKDEVEIWSKENTGKNISEIYPLSNEKMEDYNFYTYHFDYLLLNSLFISAFSLFEVHFKRLAKICENGFKSKVKLADLRGNGEIDTIRKYLFLIHNTNCTNNNSLLWHEILQFKAVRNSIVHHGSILNPDKKTNSEKIPGYNKLKEHKIWMQPENAYFRLNKIEFLEDFRDLTTNYSDLVTSELIANNNG
jgi:hypothetical protein